MNKPVDKTIVQSPPIKPSLPPSSNHAPALPDALQEQVVDATVVQAAGSKTVVTGEPRLQKLPRQAATATEGMILKQRFELVELLGSGGMGAVYRARDLRQVETGDADPWVAVKVINESFSCHEHALVSLQQETKKTQRLSHPNIVSAYDFDRDGDIAFMTMELLQGQSLDQLLRQNKSGLSQARATHILRQVTEAVCYAHQQGVVHADLKPANIFITNTGLVKVLDFGIARAIYAESSALEASSIQAFTPAYASINVLSGAIAEPKDDLYALGCIFYMLFTGQHPYQRCKATEADAARMRLARISALSRVQWKAMAALLAFHPAADLTIELFKSRFFGDGASLSKRVLVITVAALIAIITLALSLNWYNHREHRSVIALLLSTETKSLQKGVNRLSEFNDEDRVVILNSAREEVISNLRSKLENLASASDYQRTRQHIELATQLYPDSSALADLNQAFSTLRDRYVAGLVDELVDRIEQRRYQVATTESTNAAFSDLVQDLQLVDPQNALFSEYDFRTLLAREAGLAVYLGHRDLADSIVEQAVILFPENSARYQQILSRATTSQASARQGNSFTTSSEHRLADYKQAVAMAEALDLSDPEQLKQYLGALQKQNPSMYRVLSTSLHSFIQKHRITDPDLLAMKKALEPVTAAPSKVVRRDPCSISFANRGKDSRYHCRDSLTSTVKGPALVVVKGNRSQPTFAVSRLELTVEDYNQYCRLYRSCASRADNPALPVTDLSYAEAKHYVQWLSKMSGYHYALPTLEQWQLMAQDDSGIRDHNCKVYAGGRWIRGGELRPANEGYQNSLGLKNLFGNAGEWVRAGNQLFVVGGDADTELDRCGSGAINQGEADASPLRGFRVVRAIN